MSSHEKEAKEPVYIERSSRLFAKLYVLYVYITLSIYILITIINNYCRIYINNFIALLEFNFAKLLFKPPSSNVFVCSIAYTLD